MKEVTVTNLEYKNKKSNASELAHTDVFFKGNYVGYFLRQTSLYLPEGANWYFVETPKHFGSTYAKTRKDIIKVIENLFDKQ